MRVSAACCTYTQTATSILSFLSLTSVYLSLSLSLSAFLSVRLTCRRNVGRASAVLLARALPPISFPFQPLSLFYTSFPFVSALFVPLSCPLFLLSSRLSPGGARFSFLPRCCSLFLSNLSFSNLFPFSSFAYCCFDIFFFDYNRGYQWEYFCRLKFENISLFVIYFSLLSFSFIIFSSRVLFYILIFYS